MWLLYKILAIRMFFEWNIVSENVLKEIRYCGIIEFSTI